MGQTLLALLAFVVLMNYSLHQQRAWVSAQQDMLSTELEVMANAIASKKMQTIAQQGFDQSGTFAAEGSSPQDASLSDLTPSSSPTWGGGMDCSDINQCKYLENFHDMRTEVDTFQTGQYHDGNPIDFAFSIDADVEYVDDDGDPTPNRTWRKRVTLTIRNKYLNYPITAERDFSPQWSNRNGNNS